MSLSNVRTTPRFERELLRYSPRVMAQARKKVAHAIARLQQPEVTAGRSFETIEGLPRHLRAIEIDVFSAYRVVAVLKSDGLVLMRFGDKQVVPQFVNGHRHNVVDREITESKTAPAFLPCERTRSDDFDQLDVELSPQWSYYLDDEQADLRRGITTQIEDYLLGERCQRVFVILGGAGTGKTTLLLNIWAFLTGSAGLSDENWRVGLAASRRLITDIERWAFVAPNRLSRDALFSSSSAAPDIALVDDPSSLAELSHWLKLGFSRSLPMVVAADPLQLADQKDLSDDTLMSACSGADVSWLSTCYRQKEQVAISAMRTSTAIADFSPYKKLGRHKEYLSARSDLCHRAVNLEFRNPTGLFLEQDLATFGSSLDKSGSLVDFLRPLKLETRAEFVELPVALVVWDDLYRFDTFTAGNRRERKAHSELTSTGKTGRRRKYVTQLSHDLFGEAAEIVRLSAVSDVKGMEYRVVITLLSGSLRDVLAEGSRSSDLARRDYEELLLAMRIAVTRARDALIQLWVTPRSRKRR